MSELDDFLGCPFPGCTTYIGHSGSHEFSDSDSSVIGEFSFGYVSITDYGYTGGSDDLIDDGADERDTEWKFT